MQLLRTECARNDDYRVARIKPKKKEKKWYCKCALLSNVGRQCWAYNFVVVAAAAVVHSSSSSFSLNERTKEPTDDWLRLPRSPTRR